MNTGTEGLTHARKQPGLRLLVVTLGVALAAALTPVAQAQPMGGMGMAGHEGGPGMGMMGHEGGHGKARRGGAQRMERMLDMVGASAEQRAQIKQIAQTARAEMRAQHEAGRKLREQSQALFLQPAVDARAAEALRQQMMALHDQASKRGLQMMLDMSAVLTPEQRKTITDRMAQRRTLMERHRAERATLDGKAPR